MMFMPTNNEEKPAIFVVMDKILSTNPGFKKTFLLHSHQEPTVDGNVTTIVRNTMGYNGKLTMQTLYPINPTIEKVGGLGKEFWVVDQNQPPTKGSNYSTFNSLDPTPGVNNVPKGLQYGWGRVEISPSVPQAEDYFLNVMYVSDADNTSPVDNAELIETPDLLGARILDKVNIFAKNKERLDKDITFTVPGSGSVAVAVAGVKEGQWSVVDADGHTQIITATQQGSVVYFTGPASTYTMTQHPVDKRVFVSTIKTAATKVEINFTPASWSIFAEKLTAALTLNSNVFATQQEVDAANSELSTAMNALVTVSRLNPTTSTNSDSSLVTSTCNVLMYSQLCR